MTRINPWSLPRPSLPEESRSFSDGNGGDFTLRFRGLDGIGMSRAGARGNRYVADYVDPPDGQPKKPLGGPGGEVIELQEPEARLIAEFEEMQVPPEGEPPYNLVEWVGFGRNCPEAWLWAITASGALLAASQARLRDSPEAAAQPAPPAEAGS